MRILTALAATVLLLASGCLSSSGGGEDPADEEVMPPAPSDAPKLFRGTVEFGENTTEIAAVDPARPFGTTGFTYVSGYGPEPNIGVTSSGAVFTTAFSTVMRSMDGGLSWEAVHTHQPADLNNDPMLWVDQWTDTVYNAPMAPTLLCAAIYPSEDDGATWSGPFPACGDAPFDHQKLASGPAGPDTNPLASAGLHPTVLYLCYNGIGVTNCAVSYDGGLTWPVNRPTIVNTVGLILPQENPDVVSTCFSGQNGHPTVSSQGVVAFLRTWSCTQPILTYSTDSGLTWINVPGPGYPGGASDFLMTANAHSIDPEVAFTPDGTMYVLFQGHDHHAYVARTKDLGASWEGPFDVTPPGTTSTVFAALAAGDDGRIAMSFVAAAGVNGSSANAPEDARWHLYMVTSEDAASEDPTFVAYQATPDHDPVQVGPIHQGGADPTAERNDRNLLDFIDGAVAPDGSFYVSFADGCSTFNECSALPATEQTAAFRGTAGAVAWLKGWSLLAEPRTGPIPL